MQSLQAQKINSQLRVELVERFKQLHTSLRQREDLPAEVKEILFVIRRADLADYSARIAAGIAEKAIPSWQKELEAHPGESPQLIAFEWNDSDYRCVVANSYGVVGLRELNKAELPLFNDPGWDYSFFYDIEADHGFELYFFELLEQYLPYSEYEFTLEDETTAIGFSYQQLQSMIPVLNELLAHDAFSILDRKDAFDGLELRVGFPFSLVVHDGGNLIHPFYMKV
ncbi:MAG: hypothetical protein AAF597_06955 [Bacteroidota bacterium]